MIDKTQFLDVIEQKSDVILDVSDKIWEFAELSLMEFKSAALYCDVLKKEGFEVQTPVAGIKTAFKGIYGSGKPVIGILAEYDALSGLSQEAASVQRKELVRGGTGHGCGHNLLGAGAFAAALAVKDYIQKTGKGTVILYGCPGEEGGAAKAFMARERLFEEVDIALTWHPGDTNQVTSGTCNSCIQTEYKFVGIAAHAAGNPEMGRSALDAVELMNIGVQFLREHMPETARIHYAITNAGGNSPNVVQPEAKVLYMVRSVEVKEALELQKRVDKIAEAAAMMTETKMFKHFIDGCSNTVPNKTLEKLLWDNFNEIGVPTYSDEEKAFAQALVDSYEMPTSRLPGDACDESDEIAQWVAEKSKNASLPLNDFLIPYYFSTKPRAGSTDVGDVSWLVPTAQLNVVAVPSNAPGHSWQQVSCGKSSIGHKSVICAGKVLASAAIELIENPDLVQAAKDEFKIRAKAGYFCPVPADAIPIAVGDEW